MELVQPSSVVNSENLSSAKVEYFAELFLLDCVSSFLLRTLGNLAERRVRQADISAIVENDIAAQLTTVLLSAKLCEERKFWQNGGQGRGRTVHIFQASCGPLLRGRTLRHLKEFRRTCAVQLFCRFVIGIQRRRGSFTDKQSKQLRPRQSRHFHASHRSWSSCLVAR